MAKCSTLVIFKPEFHFHLSFITVKPKVYELRDTQAKEGSTGRLVCKSSGDPPPKMTWKKSPSNDYEYSEGSNVR